MKETRQQLLNSEDNSKKSILARGCDPVLSYHASKSIPKLLGNPEYVPTTNDIDFINKLKSQKWSVIYFAPGACRFSAAKHAIPGGSSQTQGWTLKQYLELVYKLQGNNVQIVETAFESESIKLLSKALSNAKEVKNTIK